MNLPQTLILLPAEGYNGAPSAYGVIEARPHFFEMLREHLRHANDLTKACAGTPAENWEGKWSADVLYHSLTGPSGWCSFIPTHPEEDFETDEGNTPLFRGIEDFTSLLGLTASSIMTPNDDVDALLDDSDGDARPAIVNFQEWYTNCRSGGWFGGSIEEFWNTLQNLFFSTELDEIILDLPLRLKVARRGSTVEYEDFSKSIRYHFSSAEKHGYGHWETKPISMPDFISAFEDVARSIR